MRRIAIIPARSGSSRIKDKNIVEFCGKPMLSYSLSAASKSELFDTIHVSTDSPRYAAIAKAAGHPVDFLRPSKMATNNVSIPAVLRWVIKQYETNGSIFDEICLIVATAPLLEAKDLIKGQLLLDESHGQFPVLSVASFPAPLERAMIIGSDNILRFTQPSLRFKHSQECPTQYFDAGAFAFFTRDQILESDEPVYPEYIPCVLERAKTADINDPEDLAMAEILYLGRQARGKKDLF
ncbi:MAG: pseudaminic acid cytidylyltransferase [Rhodospirillaceae bacterium]|nr:pseudaminic acid cytidylyltransferase [Rhodospirillaceae bacterium]|tara:strand:- start:401 stop:1114 length:714 start_codon:yes stop_codon:yes gene_type:complete